MNELKVFPNREFGNIRATEIDGEPWFIGKDVAIALGYKDTKSALQDHVDQDDKRILKGGDLPPLENHIPKTVFPVDFVAADIPNRGLTFINESGIYSFQSQRVQTLGHIRSSSQHPQNWFLLYGHSARLPYRTPGTGRRV